MENVELIFPFVALAALALGLFVYLQPRKVIVAQIRFYALINWRMEPISWGKELRNTRWMGLAVIFVALGSLVYMAFYG